MRLSFVEERLFHVVVVSSNPYYQVFPCSRFCFVCHVVHPSQICWIRKYLFIQSCICGQVVNKIFFSYLKNLSESHGDDIVKIEIIRRRWVQYVTIKYFATVASPKPPDRRNPPALLNVPTVKQWSSNHLLGTKDRQSDNDDSTPLLLPEIVFKGIRIF